MFKIEVLYQTRKQNRNQEIILEMYLNFLFKIEFCYPFIFIFGIFIYMY